MPITLPKRAAAILISVIIAAAALFALYVWFALSWSYSEGERAGYLQKLSRKGWLCKTWEGEILLSSMPGAIPERFSFSVRDPAVVKQLQSAMGQRVQLTYSQHKGIPTSCFGETEYFVDKVAVGGQQPQPASAGYVRQITHAKTAPFAYHRPMRHHLSQDRHPVSAAPP